MEKIIAACGNDCSACPRYVKHPYEKTADELRYTAKLWMKIGYRDHIVTNGEISCIGCKPENWCRYRVIECCADKELSTCASCQEYPCDNIRECFETTKSFEPKCREVCTDDEYRQLKKAFFEKEKNLTDAANTRIKENYKQTLTAEEPEKIFNTSVPIFHGYEAYGCAELRTERLILRRYRQEDADDLYRYLGTDPAMCEYSGWNPYATLELAQETVRGFIDSYKDEHVYSWVMDIEDVIVGTIGAYDFKDNLIEVGFSVVKGWQGRGFATEALKKVLEYLTENEGIPCVTAWCAAENIGSRRVLERAGMKLVCTEKDGLAVEGRVYDKLTYEYRPES